jgi:antitoxin CptB
MDIHTTRKRLRFQSWHRGCKETDIILGHFCDQHIEAMDADQLSEFEAILMEDDADLFRWLTGELPVPEHLQGSAILKALLVFDVPKFLGQG